MNARAWIAFAAMSTIWGVPYLFIKIAIGVVTLVGLDVSRQPDELLGALAVLGAALGYAFGPFILKRGLIDLDPRATMGASLAVAALVLAAPAALTAPAALPSDGALASLVVLGLLCTALAFVIFNTLIAEAGPLRASVITYVNPVVAVGLGVALLGEQPGAGAVAGLLLILAGSWMSTGGNLPPGLRWLSRRAGKTRPRRTDEGATASVVIPAGAG